MARHWPEATRLLVLRSGTLLRLLAEYGGPAALAAVLGALPSDLRAAVAVVQHVDIAFAPGLARWLAHRVALSVAPLTAPQPLRPGHVWLAAGEGHLALRDDLQLELIDEPRDLLHRPSIDVLFESVARRIAGGCGVLLTGMGRDGARGLLALRRAGFHTIAQDERSSVVWGMPRAAVEGGGASEVLPLDRIAARVAAIVGDLCGR